MNKQTALGVNIKIYNSINDIENMSPDAVLAQSVADAALLSHTRANGGESITSENQDKVLQSSQFEELVDEL